MNIQEFRQEYPDYDDLSDRVLANKLYKAHYSDMDRSIFDERFLGVVKIDPVAQAEYESYRSDPSKVLPIIQEAKKMRETVSKQFAKDWRVGAGKAVAKEIGKDISAGPWSKVWEQAGTQEANSLRAVLQTATSLSSGITSFFVGKAAVVANEMKQVITQGINAARGKGKSFSMSMEDANAWEKAVHSFFEYNVTDPIAQTMLMTIGAIPTGVKELFNTLSAISQTDKAKEVIRGISDNLPDIPFIELKDEDIQAAIGAALDTAGVVAELLAFGAVFKAAKIPKAPKAARPAGIPKKLPPTKARPPRPEGGIERLFEKERMAKRAVEKPKKALAAIEKGTIKAREKIRELEKEKTARLREKAERGKTQRLIEIRRSRAMAEKAKKSDVTLESLGLQTVYEKLAKAITKKFPEHKLKFDGVWEEGGKPFFGFTPREGPLKKKSFSVSELTLKKVTAELKDVERRFAVPEYTVEEALAILKKEKTEVTFESLGFQGAYEKTAELVKYAKKGDYKKGRKIADEIRQGSLEEILNNPLDRSAIRQLKSGKLKDYIDNMPELGDITRKELLKADPESGHLFANIRDAKGVPLPAVRKSGYYALPEFQHSLKGFKDINILDYEWTPTVYLLEKMDQGKISGPLQRHVLWPLNSTIKARNLYINQRKAKLNEILDASKISGLKERRLTGKIAEHIFEEDYNIPAETLLKRPEIASLLKKFKQEKKLDIIRTTQQLQNALAGWRIGINAARNKRGEKPIGKITKKGYVPQVMEENLWAKIGLRDVKPKEVTDKPTLPDFIRPNQGWNPRAAAREGLLEKYPKETNLFRLAADYVDTAAKDIYNTNIVHHLKIHAAVMRNEGLLHGARALDRLASEVYAGTGHPATRFLRGVIPQPIRKSILAIRRNLTRAVFPVNLSWNAFIQTTSAALSYVRYGNRSCIKGLKYFHDRAFNKEIKENVYSHIVKRRGGGVIYQDLQASISKNRKLQSSKMERTTEFLNFFTSELESGLTGHAIGAAYFDGKTRLGLKGRALAEYASEGGGKTQSFYNPENLPGLLRIRELTSQMPFQTFAMEVFNTTRELNIIGIRRIIGKAGLYETVSANSALGKATISRRLRMLARWTAAIMITNAVGEAAIGRKPWRFSSFAPFLAYILNGTTIAPIAGERKGQPLLAMRYVDEFYRGVKNLIQYGDWRQLRKWSIRYHAPAGIQIERIIQGIEAIAAGGIVRDVKGRVILKIPPKEYLAALWKGPWKTPTAIKKMREKKKKKTLRTIKVIR